MAQLCSLNIGSVSSETWWGSYKAWLHGSSHKSGGAQATTEFGGELKQLPTILMNSIVCLTVVVLDLSQSRSRERDHNKDRYQLTSMLIKVDRPHTFFESCFLIKFGFATMLCGQAKNPKFKCMGPINFYQLDLELISTFRNQYQLKIKLIQN